MNLVFWKAAAERAVKTFAQAAIAQLGTGSVGITSLDWRVILSVSAMAALASVLTSLASLSTVTPSIVHDAPAPAVVETAEAKLLPELAPATVFPTAKVEAVTASPVTVTPVFEAPAVEPAAPAA